MDELDELDRISRARRRADRVARQTELYDQYVARQHEQPQPHQQYGSEPDSEPRSPAYHRGHNVEVPPVEVEVLDEPDEPDGGGSETEVRQSDDDADGADGADDDDDVVEDDPVMPADGASVTIPTSERQNDASAAMSKIMAFTPVLAAGSEAVGQQLAQKDRGEALEKEKPTEVSLDDLLA